MGTTVALAKLKEKRQLTLPAEICKLVHADKGDLFDCTVDEGRIILTLQKVVPATASQPKAKPRRDISQYVAALQGRFGDAEDAMARIRNDRESWER